ncbi:Hypothetical predicted protein [Mytilus galloprovincialis]|uniref:Lipid-binding serum glycoprotein C-terminal domain-containing protein n=1 Tax=Mytilus galloprovincialis TaxID=29158 RepID=A0A8B6FB35_MYTGA|nr:Hypothetical predicted protein [Mytilus galloprovincialis]
MEDWNEKLIEVARKGSVEELKLCLANGANINYHQVSGWTALMLAAMGGHVEVSRLLLENRCNKDITDRDGKTALHLAAEYGELHVTRCLVEEGGISPFVKTHEDKALQFLVDSAIITTIEPMINGLGTKGFPMPSTKDLQFQQSGIKLLPNTILIETDLKYAPKSTVLKFVPMNERYRANEI